MTQPQPHTDPESRRSFVMPLTCTPPRLPADTASEHLVDRILPTGAGQWIYFAAVGALIIIAPLLPTRPGLAVGAAGTLAGSAWCLANLWRCREAHCLITGFGWLALFGLMVVELAAGRSFIRGTESSAFLVILLIGVMFEMLWQARFGTNALLVLDTGGAKGTHRR